MEVKDSETALSDKKLGSRDVDLKMQVFCATQNASIRKFHVDLKMQVNYDKISYKTQLFTVCLRICAAVVQMRIYMHARQLSSKFGMFEYVEC